MAGCDFNPPTFSLAHHVFVTPPPTSGDRHRMTLQRPLSAVYGTGRRGSINEVNNDSVLRQKLSADVNKCGTGSEWVTLSKALLMQLVEQICQLSFQSDSNVQPSLSAKPETEVDFAKRHRRLLSAAVAMDCTTNDDVVKICAAAAAAAAAKATEDVSAASNDKNDDSSLDNRLIGNALEPDRAGVVMISAETKRAIDTKFDHPVIDKNGPIGPDLRPCEDQPEQRRHSESTHVRHPSSADGQLGAKEEEEEEEVERKQPPTTTPHRENLRSRQQAEVQTHPSDECVEMEESLSKDAGSRCAAARPTPLSSAVAAETLLPSSGSASATAVAAACIDGCCSRQSAADFNMTSSKCSADDAELRQLMTSSRCLVGLNNNNVSKVPPSDEADDPPLTMSTGSGLDRPASVDMTSYRKHRSAACAPGIRRSSTDMGLHYRQHDRRYIRARRRHRIAYSTGGGGGDFICPNFAEEAARIDYAVAAGGHVTQRRPIRRVVSQQPWIAMNKTIVYQMLDAALGQQLARGEASATMTSAERRRSNNARNAIWNPAISSRSSTPDNETQLRSSSSSNRNTPATVTLSAVSPVYGSINDRIRDIGQLMELHPGLSASLMTRDQQVTCSILRELFAADRHTSSVASHPVVARRHSEATPSGPASATTPTFAVPDLPPNISPQLRRRHHSASNEALAPASVNTRYNQSAQGFSSLLFVDTTHGRDIYNYFRYPEVLPVSATASSALDYTLQTLDKQATVAEKGFSSSISPPSLFERKRKSQPEAVPALPGVTPRWVAFNKGDVSSLFETVATAMMAAETAPGASPTSATMTSSSSSLDLHSPPEVASRRPTTAAACSRTRSVGGSAESVFRRPLPESPSSEPIKWKSSLMRRMRAEATPPEAIETDENKTVT